MLIKMCKFEKAHGQRERLHPGDSLPRSYLVLCLTLRALQMPDFLEDFEIDKGILGWMERECKNALGI
jgi:hypothetical protein